MAVKGKINGKLEKKIERMETGDEGFTVPWALSVVPQEEHYDIYLNTEFSIHDRPGGTVELHIKRIGPNEDDFEVDLDSVKGYQWHEKSKFNYSNSNYIFVGQVPIF